MTSVQNMTNSNGKKVANQFIIIDSDNGLVTFQSYETVIAVYHCKECNLDVFNSWDISNTTLKFFKEFVNTQTPFDYVSKDQFIKSAATKPDRIIFK